jgi:SAM-dependent methyltransferase
MLFVELVLIRWLGAHIVHLSFFSNFVLLGSFLGIGLGFIHRGGTDWFPWSPILLAFVLALARLLPVTIESQKNGVLFFGRLQETGLPAWIMLPAVFLAVTCTMAAIADGVARLFGTFSPLDAYRLDIGGSIAGIAVFTGLSLAGAPAAAWGLVIAAGFALLFRRGVSMLQGVALVALVLILGSDVFRSGVIWSPYYRVTYERAGSAIGVNVNGVPHQEMTTLAFRRRVQPTYFLPYERASSNSLEKVLIVGAGTGSDVAIALSEGAQHVDAVEIDPRLYELGRDLNPEHPYQDPRVTVHVDDGRAYLERSRESYDLILFALPDSLTVVAGQSSLRLESYLFTKEAVEAARSHLAPGGVFAMYNFYREAWLADRLANTMNGVFGHPPCFDSTRQIGYLALITTSIDPAAVDCPEWWSPVTRPVAPAVSDDRPFLYLRDRAVPSFYLVALGLILAAATICVRGVAGPLRPMRSYLDLFFMGAAFLLLETKNVVQFALLFGTTWLVNALVFAGILVSVLLAVEVARRYRPARPLRLYVLLAGCLAVAYAVPPEALINLNWLPRFLIASALAFAPVFVANLVFAERFRTVAEPQVAFGANLLGALVGGVIEYWSLVVGYRALLIVAGVIYGLALLAGHRHLVGRRPVEATSRPAAPATASAVP